MVHVGQDMSSLKDEEIGESVNEKAVIRKLNRHILLKFFLMCILCYIDRTNLAFAALQLNKSLGFSEQVYGLGSSVFFIGYSALQIPSNLMLVRFGARRWLSLIIICWGIVATLFASLRSVFQFYALRLLLGVTESGTFPGMWFHMSLFYSEREMGVAYAWINAGTALSQVFGAPLAALLLSLDGLMGLRGWQWLFIVEGLPTIFLGIWIHQCLAPAPLQASFLKQEEAEWLHRRQLSAKPSSGVLKSDSGSWSAVTSWKTWYLASIALLEALVKNSIIYWSPLIIASLVGHEHARANPQGRSLLEGSMSSLVEGASNSTGSFSGAIQSIAAAPMSAHVAKINEHAASNHSGAVIALLTALPFGSAALIMLFMAKHSASTGERRYHATLPFVVATIALSFMSALIDRQPSAAFVSLLAATVLWGPAGIISALPATFLSGPAAATGVALINSIANIGGMLGPFMVGALRHSTDSYQGPIALLAFFTAMTSILVYLFPMERSSADGRVQPLKKSSTSD